MTFLAQRWQVRMSIWFAFSFKDVKGSPGWCGSVDWVMACEPKGHWFNFQSGYMPGLWTRSLAGSPWEATTQWCISAYVSTSLPLSLKINKILFLKRCEGQRVRHWDERVCTSELLCHCQSPQRILSFWEICSAGTLKVRMTVFWIPKLCCH